MASRKGKKAISIPKPTGCSHCETGWVFADEVRDVKAEGLVRCPVCRGSGRLMAPEAVAARF